MGTMFGTNGIRGVINKDMSSELALQVGKAIGKVYGGTVAIATDTRVSADMLKSAVSSGLMAVGVNVLDLGVIPTPALQYFVKVHDDVSGGVMITASHNPPEFNGIKCVSSDGTEASRMEEANIEDIYPKDIPCVPWTNIGEVKAVTGAAEAYIDAVISNVDAEAISNAGLTVCVDCANGAAHYTTPLLLKKLNVRAITINGNAQGEFPGHNSEPTEENLKDLMALTRITGADLGVAHDGDADRCVFVTSEGRFVPGDKSLSLIAKTILMQRKGKIVTPVSSSSMVEDVVNAEGGVLKYTAVGSPIVARKMMEYGAIFGGEENGGLIFPEMQYCRDGAMTLAKMLECIVRNGPLEEQISKLPVYYTDKAKVECPNERKVELLDHFKENAGDARVDDTDGLKLIFDDGWVLLRPSGTEPIFRIYSESKDEAVAKQRADEFVGKASEYLSDKV